MALYVDDNMIVSGGVPLAQLDPVPFQLEVDRALADLAVDALLVRHVDPD